MRIQENELPPDAEKRIGHRDISLERVDKLTKEINALKTRRETLKPQTKDGTALREKIKELETTREKILGLRISLDRGMKKLRNTRDTFHGAPEASPAPARVDSNEAAYVRSIDDRISGYESVLADRGYTKPPLSIREEVAVQDKEDTRAEVVAIYDHASTEKDEEGVEKLIEGLPSEALFLAVKKEYEKATSGGGQQNWFSRTWGRLRRTQNVPDTARIEALAAYLEMTGKTRAEAEQKILELEQRRAALAKVAGATDPQVIGLENLVKTLSIALVRGGSEFKKSRETLLKKAA